MPNYDITVFLGGIRPFLWEGFYKSVMDACPRHKAQVIICGPGPVPKELIGKANFKFVRDYGGPARAAQLAAKFAEGTLITLGADDGTYDPSSLSDAIDVFYENEKKAGGKNYVLGLKYGEGGNLMPDPYWKAWHHPPLKLAGIPVSSPMVLNTIMRRELFEECGGYDLKHFSTCNWGGHDLYQRLITEYKIEFSFHEKHVLRCTWTLEDAGVNDDHVPVAQADHYLYPESDYKYFREKYSQINPNKDCKERDKLFSWQDGERFWSKRFKIKGN